MNRTTILCDTCEAGAHIREYLHAKAIDALRQQRLEGEIRRPTGLEPQPLDQHGLQLLKDLVGFHGPGLTASG